jgi:hypothetical protein
MSTPEQQQAYAQGYHVGYEHGMQAAQQAQGGGSGFGPGPAHPFNVVAQYPERSSRVLMFFFPVRGLLLFPHLIVMWLLGIGAGFVMFIAWFAVVFTGNYPRGLWNFMVGVNRWQVRMGAYMLGLTDQYPPFSLE